MWLKEPLTPEVFVMLFVAQSLKASGLKVPSNIVFMLGALKPFPCGLAPS